MRRRRTTDAAETPSDPIDEDDQAQLVASLQKEGLLQIEQTNGIFSGVCILAMCSFGVVVVIHGGGLLPFSHALYSCAVCWLARIHATSGVSSDSLTQSSTNQSVLLVVLAMAPLLRVVMAARGRSSADEDDTTLHLSLALSTLLVTICSILLRIESTNTIKGIKALEGSKYNYKSL